MAILLNHTSNLRLRLELLRRLSDGVRAPASLALQVAVERYARAQEGLRDEPSFVPLVALAEVLLHDLDLIRFLEELEVQLGQARATLSGTSPPPERAPEAALEAGPGPTVFVRVQGGPEVFLAEVGIDLGCVLEPVGGAPGLPGEDAALFRFPLEIRALLAFSAALLDEFARFPTDPALVEAGRAE